MFLARIISVGNFVEWNNSVGLTRIQSYLKSMRMSEVLNLPSKKSPSKNQSKAETTITRHGKKNPLRQLQISEVNVNIKSVKRKQTFTVAVEGNIGSGKSTFLKHFCSHPEVTTYQEPIEKWTDVGGNNLLKMLYENPKRWSFLFQSYVQLTRLQIHLDKISFGGVKLIERSFHNNRFCFVESDYKAGNLAEEEFEVICSYYDFFEKNFSIEVDLIVYIKTTPEVVYERMKRRGRQEEKDVPLEYLEQVHKYYERWLVEGKPRKPLAPILTINGDFELDKIFEEYEKYKNVILGKSFHETKT